MELESSIQVKNERLSYCKIEDWLVCASACKIVFKYICTADIQKLFEGNKITLSSWAGIHSLSPKDIIYIVKARVKMQIQTGERISG